LLWHDDVKLEPTREEVAEAVLQGCISYSKDPEYGPAVAWVGAKRVMEAGISIIKEGKLVTGSFKDHPL
jgi:hypothetical protein